MSKSEQTGGGGGTETKPKEKRPWRKPRVRLVEFAATEAAPAVKGYSFFRPESTLTLGEAAYDPNIS